MKDDGAVSPDDEHGRPAGVVPRYSERFASVLMEAGIPRMPARVFAALMVADAGRLTAAEIADRLMVSAAAVSGAVRYLMQVDLIGREHVRGARSTCYVIHDEVFQEAVINRDKLLVRWIDSCREGVEVLGADTPAGARMAGTMSFFQFLREEMPGLMDRWREHRAGLPRPGVRQVDPLHTDPARTDPARTDPAPDRSSPDRPGPDRPGPDRPGPVSRGGVGGGQ
jgi:DNA-binding transcriptional regulator GbsR (MarR family)